MIKYSAIKGDGIMSIDFSGIKSGDELYDVLSHDESFKLVKDENDLSERDRQIIKDLKAQIIRTELLNLSREDVLDDISLLVYNIPDDITPLQKVRWLYIQLGKLFSYDYRVAKDVNYGTNKKFNPSQFIGRYQTCIQISEIVAILMNSIEGVRCNIIERKLPDLRFTYANHHVGNEVIVDDNGEKKKLLLDLTLDLYLIQADCMTKHFGYEDDGTGTYDIIPLIDIRKMDEEIGLVVDGYTDDRINEAKNFIDIGKKLSDKELIEYRLLLVNKFVKRFNGYHEGKQYINMLLCELLQLPYHEYNLYYDEDNGINLKTVYKITYGDAEKWIVYSNRSGVISTSREKLNEILNHGWNTNSKSLPETVKPKQLKKEKKDE